jgi:hypothetical protein
MPTADLSVLEQRKPVLAEAKKKVGITGHQGAVTNASEQELTFRCGQIRNNLTVTRVADHEPASMSPTDKGFKL